VCKKLIKNFQPFVKNVRTPQGEGIFWLTLYTSLKSAFNGLQFRRWHYRSIFIRLAVIASQIRKVRRNSDKIWPYNSSRSSKVIDFGVNRKLTCDFLLVTNSNFGRICYRFRDIVTTLKARKSLNFPTPPFFETPARGEPVKILWWNLASEN